ncbi:MAG TPA: hypothetical protein VHQ70_06640 [Syntrophomonadaceae bacterium]|nr:hypothetical protein [Syntrophomonadaceae bacterium]
MKIILAIDDSRQIDGAKAGKTTSTIANFIEENGWGKCSIPSRHRLYPHPSTGCKKHNTARSFSADLEKKYLPGLIDYACNLVKTTGDTQSNAGLAIIIPELMENQNLLIDYAYKAKDELVSKEEALEFSGRPGIYLFELSGNGRGIIGALAGAGLRLTGNDGQFRGKLHIGTGEDYIATVREIIDNSYVQQVKNMDFEDLNSDECVRMGEKVKIVLLDHKYTLMVFPTEIEYPKWQTSTTSMLRVF